MSKIIDRTQAAWELYAAELTKLPGVISVATGRRVRGGKETKEMTVIVTVRRKVSPNELSSSTMVPRELPLPDGSLVGTDVVEDESAQYTPDQDTANYRPVPGGCQINPFGSGFVGTLGGWFCAPVPGRRAAWNTVWLTNAHVADPVTFSAVPADPRMTQPSGAAVIGNTTAISGWPNPLPGPGVTVAGVVDAAIGTLAEGVDPDYQVLQIAPAPFEIGTATAGLAVQKRGRTTLLRNGTVVTQGGGGAFLAVNINSPAGGLVTFGLPGQPRVFAIDSPGTGVGVAFGMPGDSGSLVFGTAAGRLQSTVPCVGLYFAGNGSWVSQQPNPNLFTVRGFAFDITNVMGQLALETVCTCVVRSILAAILGSNTERADADQRATTVSLSERMMRGFRDRVLARSRVGRIIAEAVAETAPDASRVLTLDPTAYGLAVEMLEPWARASTSLAVLNRRLDKTTVAKALELAERVMELAPATRKHIDPLTEVLKRNEGQPVRKLLGRISFGGIPPVDQSKPKREPKRKS